jgi:hypothetical protein
MQASVHAHTSGRTPSLDDRPLLHLHCIFVPLDHSPELRQLEMLKAFVVLDPNTRVSAKHALKMEYFSGLPAKQKAAVTTVASPDEIGESFAFERQREVHTSLEALKALVTADVDKLSAELAKRAALQEEAETDDQSAQTAQQETPHGDGQNPLPLDKMEC